MALPRRTLITIAGGTIIGFATAGATGAFDMVEVDRDVTVAVEGDANGALTLEPHPNRTDTEQPSIASLNADGLLTLDFTGVPINDGGVTRYHDVIQATNNGASAVTLTVTPSIDGGPSLANVTVYEGTSPSATEMNLAVGDTASIGIEFDTTDSSDATAQLNTLTFTATSSA